MEQLTFLAGNPSSHCTTAIVNVATVPQRSPFRYPGGKTWLIPHIRTWFSSLPTRPALCIEPFAGGGIVSLTVAFEQLAERIIMVERDPQVAAVWRTILEGDAEALAHAITTFQLSLATLTEAVKREPTTVAEMALQTILKNRTNRGGILAPGAGKMNHGENGKGLLSRWYPETISRRIREIVPHRGRLSFIEGDGIAVCQQHAADRTAIFFIDPPYTASSKRAGSRLYRYSVIDHRELFRIASTFAGDFLMTYDNAEELRALAAAFGFDTELVAMKNTHHAAMNELLIGRNLDWVRQARRA